MKKHFDKMNNLCQLDDYHKSFSSSFITIGTVGEALRWNIHT